LQKHGLWQRLLAARVDLRPNAAKVGDMGIDGRIYPISAIPKKDKGELGFMDVWYPIQVKQKDKVGRPEPLEQ
jgi:hypothetical protein